MCVFSIFHYCAVGEKNTPFCDNDKSAQIHFKLG